ncbi:TetR/AcrR family transcriptional regulator [Jiangella ureilytica]|uniref:TetR/AcrR family transcriptional regulator n=1 Tax=Jiangella ureilytica TaxID=2530374 RepID=A0A4R4RKB7_9ACTN|nr:TetR/AcrR family transcriptional regulator [Jiangella ureilytica]TDC50007.1 TetR/AcrR family transcriptional regulator [Jiangella ureilytica]
MESSSGPAKKPAARSGGKPADKAPARAQVNNIKAEELLGRIIEIVRSQGLAGFSLDNLAPQLGTSSRMLVYYFGSKDELLGRIVYTLRNDIVTQLENEPVGTITDAVDRWWSHYQANPADMQFFFHLTSRSFEEPDKFQEFSSTAVGQWSAYFVRSLEGHVRSEQEAEAIARLVLATVRGLMADLLITADRQQAERSLAVFKELLEARLAASAKSL